MLGGRSGGGFLVSGGGLTSGGTITGNLTVTGTINTGAATLASAAVTGAATVGTTLAVTGTTTAAGINASALIAAAAAVTVGTTLDVTGAATHSSTTALNGTTSMGTGAQLLLDASNSLTVPPLAFVGDPNSGMRRIGADNPGLVANGTAILNWNDSVVTNAVNTTSTGTLTANGMMVVNGRLTIDPETVKTGNYPVVTTDVIVIMNGTALTATLPASPTASMAVWIKNVDVGTCTVARNGKQIDNASADLTLVSGGAALLFYNSTGWFKLN